MSSHTVGDDPAEARRQYGLVGLDQVDEIIVLRQGKVVQGGSYAECRHSALSGRW
jgi:hypothetical protein